MGDADMRSAEQIAADEALTLAIEHAAKVHGVLDDGDMIGEYVIPMTTQQLDENGNISFGLTILYRDGRIHTTHAVGLLEDAKLSLYWGLSRD